MRGPDGESKDDIQGLMIDLDQETSRADFLKKLIAGGVISAVALSGLGGLKAFAEKDSKSNSGNDGNNGLPGLIVQVNQLRTQLDTLQSQFGNIISGKSVVPEMTVQKLTVPDTGFIKINGDSTFYKLTVPDTGFLKIDGDASFVKLDAAEITAQKIVAKSITTQEPTIP